MDVNELYGSIDALTRRGEHPFTNRGESLFNAVAHVPVDFWGRSAGCGAAQYDLQRFVAAEGTVFDTRDELLELAGGHAKVLGKLIFALLYGGRPIRRVAE